MGVVKMSKKQEACFGKIARYTGHDAECWHNVYVATKGNPPITICIPGCFFAPKPTYLSKANIDCDTCKGFIQSVFTLVHECVHKRQVCLSNTLDCMEWEAYKLSIQHMKTSVRPKCRDIVEQGLCENVRTCRQTIDDAIESEQQDLEFYRARCKD